MVTVAVKKRSAWSAGAVGAGSTVVSVLPKTLVAAMIVQVGGDLGFGATGLGIAVAMYWLANAAVSVPMGRLADRLGAIWSLRAAAIMAGTSALGIALVVTRWWQLVGFLMLAGAAHAVGHPAGNRLLVNTVRLERLGAAFGLKAIAAPAASALSGLSVGIALLIGWRWAFGICALLAVGVGFAAGRRPAAVRRSQTPSTTETPLHDRSMVVALAAAFGLATSSSMTVSNFFVGSAVTGGIAPSVAGTVLAVASGMALVTRVVTGSASDRITTGHLRLCAVLQAVGALGIALLAVGGPVVMALGAVIALIGAWGFNAMFWYALVRHYRDVPGRITGAVQPGAAIGGILLPPLFGAVADSAGYTSAWAMSGTVMVVAAVTTFFCARRLDAVVLEPEPSV